jgi:chitin disaccharide deacetylase
MVRWAAATSAATYARANPRLSVGLHVDLGEWAFRQGAWVPMYEVVPMEDPSAIASEVASQLAAFRRLIGKDPTHLDSHQHVHREEPVRSLLLELAERLRIPLRGYSGVIRYDGDFYGQTAEGSPLPGHITGDALIATLRALPPGITELSCHPGLGDDLDSMYSTERSQEVRALCDPRIRMTIRTLGIELHAF